MSALPHRPARPAWLLRTMVLVWLLYSGGLLAWNAVHDPLFSLNICNGKPR
jgi:hypothetical protein